MKSMRDVPQEIHRHIKGGSIKIYTSDATSKKIIHQQGAFGKMIKHRAKNYTIAMKGFDKSSTTGYVMMRFYDMPRKEDNGYFVIKAMNPMNKNVNSLVITILKSIGLGDAIKDNIVINSNLN